MLCYIINNFKNALSDVSCYILLKSFADTPTILTEESKDCDD